MPITIADVAARAKVSKTTVSRVLNGKGELDESTAARVRKVIDELGYVPSSRAVGLARGRTRVVGMLVPFNGTTFYIDAPSWDILLLVWAF